MEEIEGELIGEIAFGSLMSKAIPDENDDFQKSLDKIPPLLQAGNSKAIENYNDKNVYNILDVAEPIYNIGNLIKTYDISSYHASAIDAKIDNTVGLGYTFEYTRVAEKARDAATKKSNAAKRKLEVALEDIRDQLGEFVEQINGLDEFEQTLIKFVQDYFVTGNGYLEVGRDSKGSINYLGHIPAKNIRIRNNRDGFVQFVAGKYVFFRNYKGTAPDPFNGDRNPHEVIHLKKYSGTDDYYGTPETVSIQNAIAGMEFAQRYNIEYFENKAVPRYIIKTKGFSLTTEQQTNLLTFIEGQTKGVNHRSIMIPMPGGDKDIEFVPVEAGDQDSSWTGYIKENIQFIMSRHRVPPGRVGISSAASSQGETEMSEKSFKEVVCKPVQRLVNKKINKVISEMTDLFEFKLKEYALTDEDQKSQIYERFLRWGVMVPDEVRVELGWQPRADGKGAEPLDQKTLAEVSADSSLSQQKAEQKSQTYQNRNRDQERSSQSTDSSTSTHSRNVKGSGRKAGT